MSVHHEQSERDAGAISAKGLAAGITFRLFLISSILLTTNASNPGVKVAYQWSIAQPTRVLDIIEVGTYDEGAKENTERNSKINASLLECVELLFH